MSVYITNIITAAIVFPFIAFVITVPYMIHQYRKFGSVPWLHTLVVYSFVFYLMCAYFLVLLPLPADHSAYVPYAAHPQLVPFSFVRDFLAETTFSATDPSTWLGVLRDPYIYEAIFNVLLLVPLGMYLRYYFRRTWWQTLIIGFLVTLSFETTQLTGIWGLYEHPYRLFDVDDLITNTTGAMVGFWLVGPMMRVLPDMRLINEEAREEGARASVTRRALSFALDTTVALVVTLAAGFVAMFAAIIASNDAISDEVLSIVLVAICAAVLLVVFALIPALTHGQTIGQKVLRLRIVRPDASPARWYQPLARYGLLALFAWLPFAALFGLMGIEPDAASETGTLASALAANRMALVVAWCVLMGAWALTLLVRAFRAWHKKRPFVMLNGLLSNTRVMTEDGIARARERQVVLDVKDVVALEQQIAQSGTPLAELMERAGCAVAEAVRARIPDPAPVVVLTGSGNNGGDGWVCAYELARVNYPVTLVVPDIAERIKAEPAHTTALSVFSAATERTLPLTILVAPDADILNEKIDGAHAIVDAMLGTGFSGDEVREPYASWIEAANRRRFEGTRGRGRGNHRKRSHARGQHEHAIAPRRAKDAPFTVAVDVPSGLSAQTGDAATPCLAADVTVTMIVYKPGLVLDATNRFTGMVHLAKLVEI